MQASGRAYKDAVYGQFARIGKALASPRRLELLDLLCQAPRTVDALAGEAGQSLANTSHHLQVLHGARLVESERKGAFVTYRLADDDVAVLYRSLRALAESRLAELEQVTRLFLDEREAMEPIGAADLIERMRSGRVTLLDVRPEREYRSGHIPGAVSAPLGELEGRLEDFDRDGEIVAYCRGPYCVLAIEAVARLRARGFDAVRMEDGVPEWRARGFDVETAGAPL